MLLQHYFDVKTFKCFIHIETTINGKNLFLLGASCFLKPFVFRKSVNKYFCKQ